MSDAYSKWLGIPDHLRPPTHYQLLAIAPAELDHAIIAEAADRQIERLRPHVLGPDGEECRRIEQEVIHARNTLLDPLARQRYDQLTPDAAQPWWAPETGPAPPAPPVPIDGWWRPDGAPSDEPAAKESTPATVPVEGWWQGETSDAHLSADAVEQLAPATSATEPSESTSPRAGEVTLEAPPLPPPAPAKSVDWWKKPPDELPLIGPPPLPVTPKVSTPARDVELLPPPQPTAVPAPPPTPRPIVSEKALTFGPPAHKGSPIRLAVFGVAAIALAGIAFLAWKRPWEKAESSPIDRPVTKIDPQPSPPDDGKKRIDPPIVAGPDGEDPDRETIDVVPRVVDGGKVDPMPKPAPMPPADPNEFTQPVSFRGHQGGVYGVAVSRTGKTILTVSEDRNVYQYSPKEAGKHVQVHRLLSPGVGVVLCNEDRDAIFCDGGDIVVFDMTGRKIKATFENPRGGIRSLAAAFDGTFVLTGATDGCVRWWSVPARNLAHTLDVDDKAAVTALAITADAKSAAFGLSDGRICQWDLQKRREVKKWKAHKGAVTALAFSPDGKRIASAGDDNLANVWQANGTLVQKLSGHGGPVLAVGWCTDGRRVLTGGVDKEVRLWSEASGWKSEWSSTVSDKVFSIAVDSKDRFVLAGQSNGATQLIPLRASRPANGTDQ